jgi:hypothetical protein
MGRRIVLRSVRLAQCIFLIAIVVAFQNCSSPVAFGTAPVSVTSASLRSTKAVFAARGINCMACHGAAAANILTDFGYGSGNFGIPTFFPGTNAQRTAYNDVDDGGIGGWQSFVVNGSVMVPKIAITGAQAQSLFGVSSISLPDVLNLTTASESGGVSMAAGVTPAAGQAAIVGVTSLTIAYPTAAEILALLPLSMQNGGLAISTVTVTNQPTPQVSGLAADPTNKFITNTGTVQCYGDVAINGPLFLNNLNLQTNASGCRLYVTQTVFIQGPVTYVGGITGENLQITSARAVMMGFSAVRMGYSTSPSSPSTNRTNNSVLTTAGGPWPRFLPSNDSEYNPSLAPINGVQPTEFFDSLVSDAVLIGSQLLDAGDPAALATAAQTVSEPSNAANGNDGGSRVSINYSGLLLNAPHVHSRYAGAFQGAIIADVAMMARNPTTTDTIGQFEYDPIFDTLPTILPALTTNILVVVP